MQPTRLTVIKILSWTGEGVLPQGTVTLLANKRPNGRRSGDPRKSWLLRQGASALQAVSPTRGLCLSAAIGDTCPPLSLAAAAPNLSRRWIGESRRPVTS
jgi:hypothetical protein